VTCLSDPGKLLAKELTFARCCCASPDYKLTPESACIVQKIPLMDYVGRPLLGCLFVALLLLQWRFPLRRQHFSVLHRLVRNFVLSIPGFAIARLAMLPIPIAIAFWARERHIGLMNWLELPTWAVVIATFLLMDYAYWWWHWAMHMVPVFWRFHNVHHTDLDLDVSTAARFHFGEMILSIGFLSLAVALFGIGPIMLVVFFITFEAATLFHHSNWRLPIGIERVLNLILVTPRMHGIHHSIVQRETNSNWGTMFCWWDKLHGTLRLDVPQDAITVGVAAYREENELTLGKLFALPFRGQREWRLPNGEIPEREPQPAKKLAG
jgi:sterol desaturase/sphingolipid hydroxylase (fatty acid hydroxylase superfamily)